MRMKVIELFHERVMLGLGFYLALSFSPSPSIGAGSWVPQGALRPSSGRSARVIGAGTLGHAFTPLRIGCATARTGVRLSVHGHRFASLPGTWRHLTT